MVLDVDADGRFAGWPCNLLAHTLPQVADAGPTACFQCQRRAAQGGRAAAQTEARSRRSAAKELGKKTTAGVLGPLDPSYRNGTALRGQTWTSPAPGPPLLTLLIVARQVPKYLGTQVPPYLSQPKELL